MAVEPTTYHDDIALLIATMAKQPMTRSDIEMFTGMTAVTVRKWISAFHGQNLIYIIDYDLDAMGRLRVPKYLFDPGKSDIPVKIAKQRRHERMTKGLL